MDRQSQNLNHKKELQLAFYVIVRNFLKLNTVPITLQVFTFFRSVCRQVQSADNPECRY